MYDFLAHFHSGWRWVLLALLVGALVNSLLKWRRGAAFEPGDLKLNLYAMSAAHLQLIVGFALYFLSDKVQFFEGFMANKVIRFYAVEHLIMMLAAIALITIGYVKSKRSATDSDRFRLGFRYFLAALLALLAGIPWPFRTELGAGWF